MKLFPVALALLGGLVVSRAQENAVSGWDVEIPTPIADGARSPIPPKPKPVHFKVLASNTRRQKVTEAPEMPELPPVKGTINVTVHMVEDPGLPDPPPLPTTIPSDPAVIAKMEELRGKYRGTELIFVSATVYDHSRTLLRIFPNGKAEGEISAWTNMDFNHFSGFSTYRIKDSDGTFSDRGLLMGISNIDTDKIRQRLGRQRDEGEEPEPPILPELAVSGPSFTVIEGETQGEAMDTLCQIHDLYQTTTFAYNARNLVESKIDPVGTTTYGYDDCTLLKTVTEGAAVISRTYDERGRLKTFTTADGDLIQYKYDANNNLKRLTYPPDAAHPTGKQVNYTYNSRNLLETVTDWSNRVTTYTYDRLGRLTGTLRPNGTNNQIAYDAANQLTSIKESAGGKLINYLAFQYDAASQIKSRLRAPLVNSGWQHPALVATYDDDNRLLTANGTNVTHDVDGNMTRSVGILPTSLSTAVDLTYNSRNQLTNAAGVSYTYDAEGRRRTLSDATGTTRDIIDPSGKLLVRISPSGTKTYYVYGLGLLYEANQADATKTYHFDQVGSTLLRTDDSGKVIGQAEYSAYGLTTWKQGDMATPFLYNGQAGVQTDPNGLLNMRARYYSPYLCRFLNADPSGFSGGPNWFAYADGNPISLSDPFGLCAESGGGFMGYNSWSEYGNDAAESLGGVALGLTEGLSGGVISIDNSTRNAMTELQRTGYHIGLTTSLIGAFFAPKATSAPKAQIYSGVYIPEIDTIMMRPSTYIDPPPSGHVPASGGHATVMAEMASGGVDVTNAQGFTAFSKGSGFEVEWFSKGVNGTNPNFSGNILPQELRPPVLNAIERSTGFPANSTLRH